jgi:cyanophycinase
MQRTHTTLDPLAPPAFVHASAGPLVIIGGHEDKDGDRAILRRLVLLAGGPAARVLVVPTASETPAAAGAAYHKALTALGVREVQVLKLDTRGDAMGEGWVVALDRATAVFFTGGDQLRITSTLGGTPFHAAVAERHRRGLVVAGTSAGASMMTDTMIVEGAADESPTRNTVHLAVGMGLWPGAVVDQHFSERGRIGRLLSALAQNPAVLGVGIDENTAVEVDFGSQCFSVLGEGTVTVLDGRGVDATNASESTPQQPLALTHVFLHVLAPGWAFLWQDRQPVAPAERRPSRSDGGTEHS